MTNYLLEITNIYSENPSYEQWKLLSQFAYTTNVSNFLTKKGFTTTPELEEFIAGCIRQSEAYFNAFKNTPLDISPLLLYYGATNLLVGVGSMLQGNKLPITNHGMRLTLPSNAIYRIADTEIQPINSAEGALQNLSNVFSNNCQLVDGSKWLLEEVFSLIPDLRREFGNCYPIAKPHTVAIEIVKRNSRIAERIDTKQIARFNTPQDLFSLICDFSSFYLEPQISAQSDFIFLNRRQTATSEIGSRSISGRKYLELGYIKKSTLIAPNQIIVMFMGLFALGYLSRYHPEKWNPFIRSDNTGEKLLIEKFLSTCARFLPNLILSVIHNTHFQFVSGVEGTLDLSVKTE